MKKIQPTLTSRFLLTALIATMLICCTSTQHAYGQTSNTYTFAQSSGTYAAVTGTTSTATGDDGVQDGIALGFTFNFAGTNYTSVGVTTNGFIKFENATTITTGTPNYTNAIGAASNAPLVAAMWDDDNLTGGTIIHTTTGSGTSHIFTMQWTNDHIGNAGSTSSSTMTYQIKLYETTNVIQIIYGGASGTLNTTTASIGITSASGNYLSVTPAATSTASSTTANDGISSATNLPSGRTFTFTPPVPAITGLGSTSGCVGTSITITGTNLLGATTSNLKIGGTAVTSITSNTATQIVAVVGSGTTGTVTLTTAGGTATSASTFTVSAVPANPANPTSNSPQCASPGVTLTRTGTPPGGETWYWQGTAAGTTTTAGVNDGSTYNVTSSGTTYIRSYNGTCWSTGAGSLAVTITAQPSALATAPSPGNAATGVCYSGSGAVSSVSWTAASGATSYDVYFGAGSLPGSVTSTVATASYPTGALLANTTYYWKVVPKNACGNTTGTPIQWSFTTSASVCYCSTTPGTVNAVDIVTKVVLTNSVPASYTNSSTSNGSTNYDIYNNTPLNLYVSSTTNTLAITFGTDGTQYSAAWIDFNQSGTYDAGEIIALASSSAGGSATVSYTFTVPSGATAGLTRMRVRGGSDNAYTAAGACTTSTFGETEDYLVNIVALCTAPTITTQPSTATQALCVGGSSTALTVATSAGSPTYQWYSNTTASNSGGTLISGATSASYSPSTAATGTLYYYCIVTASACPATSAVSGAVTVTTVLSSLAATPSPSNSATGTCYSGTGAVSSVSWTVASGATSYDVYFGAGSLPGSVTSNVATASYTTGTLLPNTTYYWKVVPKNSCGATTGSPTTWTFTTSATPCYCTPTYTNACSSLDIINNFSLNTLVNNGSGCNGNTNNYINYPTSSYTTTLIPGTTYTASVTIGSGGKGNVGIWIDYNDNGVFETTERYVNASLIAASGTASISIPVASGANTGVHKIRVREVRGTSLAVVDPCTNGGSGETEDYTITICAPVSITGQSTATQTVCKGGSLTALTVSSSTATGYQWYSNTTASNTGGTAVTTGTGGTTSSYTPSTTMGSSQYYYCVASSSCASVTSAVSGLITVTAPFTPSAITGTTTLCAGSTTTLSSALPSGGAITSIGTYPNSSYVQTFTSSGTLVVPSGITDLNADVLIVAGGGGGGNNGGGGGGGGGVNYAPSISVPAGSTTVTIGGGGAAAVSNSVPGSNGTNSSLGSLVTAIGGGGGASRDGGAGGQDGGSGGGGSGATAIIGTCNPSAISDTWYDDDYPVISTTITCLPAGATITGMNISVSVSSGCNFGYYDVAWSQDGFNTGYEYGCSGTYATSLWNGLGNGAVIYIGLEDDDFDEDIATYGLNATTTIFYTAPGTRYLGGLGTGGQGNNGSNGTLPDAACNAAGGGGGGAGGLGTAGTGSGVNSIGGNGGAGAANSITGTSVTYGGGGGGGATGYIGCGSVTNVVNGTGGTGGGSNGESGTSGTANTGGGGGAETGGGSGVVILKYPGGQWTTSDPTIATVDQAGVVTGVAAGTATITYTVAIGTCTNQTSTLVTVLGAAANVQLATSSVNAVTLVEQCTDGGGWSYYADPASPNNWLFGIYKNGNTFAPSVNLTVNPSLTETRDDAAKKASYTMDRYWNITIAGSISPSQPVKVRFFYSPSDTTAMRSAAVSRASAYGLPTSRINGIEWFKTTAGIAFDPGNNTPVDVPNKMLPTVAYGTLNGISYVDYQGLVSFSGGTAGMRLSPSGGALPVQLLYVTATPEADSYIRLDWATATEISNKGFEIERSADGMTYESIGWADGHDNSNTKIEYSYNDKTVAPNNIYYYRLKQIDMDGKSDLSNIVSGTILGKDGFVVESLRPNPASDKVTVQVVSTADQSATVSVTDLLGREVSSQEWHIAVGFNGTDIDLSPLVSGSYNVVVKTQNQYFTKKLIVKR